MKIVIGYDGSASSAIIFEDLKRAALPKRLDAMVVTVASVSDAAWLQAMARSGDGIMSTDPSFNSAIAEANATARDAADRLRALFPLWNVSTAEGLWESPVFSLVQKAEEWKADLLVVGAHGHSALGRFIGSVSQMVLVHSLCPVRVARPPVGNGGNRGLRILVGYDGSPGSEKLLPIVASRPWPAGTNIRLLSAFRGVPVVHTSHLVPPQLSFSRALLEEQRVEAEQIMARALVPFHGLGIEAESLVKEGNAKDLLLKEAEEWKADCVFLGASGIRTMRRFFLGSVSSAVAARADCSVEIVR